MSAVHCLVPFLVYVAVWLGPFFRQVRFLHVLWMAASTFARRKFAFSLEEILAVFLRTLCFVHFKPLAFFRRFRHPRSAATSIMNVPASIVVSSGMLAIRRCARVTRSASVPLVGARVGFDYEKFFVNLGEGFFCFASAESGDQLLEWRMVAADIQ